ncbi:MAG: bifunctional ADP-dependent NAD(P)H-hydrate dehydratase/NAD(P)H-hydrate epimerase, partial [Muribaculaceae bacterium]|nr:bifunctional ADP-dependent NAD(P)H-hydrate dehydratase/NAD(P)H-hydrate epimerase [Muribaculaceae bacterium]
MKLFTNEEIRAIDRFTIENEGVTSLDLIERVAEGVTDEICTRWRPNKPTVVFAGPGNNGADALAAARLLYERGFRPEVYLFNIGGDKLSADCVASRDRMRQEVPDIAFTEVISRFNMPQISKNHLV